MRIILLDSSPMSLITHPQGGVDALACREWLQRRVLDRDRIVFPEIIDYELRRELLRSGKTESIQRLGQFAESFQYLPISTEMLRAAAALWARSRRTGKPTGSDDTLDVDVILAAQALNLTDEGEVMVATTNRKHLERFVRAEHWNEIR